MPYLHKPSSASDITRRAMSVAERDRLKRTARVAALKAHPSPKAALPLKGKRRDAWEVFERQVWFPEVLSMASGGILERDACVTGFIPCQCYRVLGGDKCEEARFCTIFRLAAPDRHGDWWSVPKIDTGPCAGRANLEPHHLQRQGSHPELRFRLDNIIVVAPACHDRIHGPAATGKE